MKYHLGCGSQYMNGYLNVDFPSSEHNVNDNVKADLYTDILQMKYEECDEIRSHHFFEHFNYFETMALLYKWTNALIIGGKLIIDVPDLNALCLAYISTADVKKKFVIARYLFGSHEADWAYHINGWSEETLVYLLNELGYKIITVKKYGDINDEKPNCGMQIESIKKAEANLKTKMIEVMSYYKNGNTEFENFLHEYFVKIFVELI